MSSFKAEIKYFNCIEAAVLAPSCMLVFFYVNKINIIVCLMNNEANKDIQHLDICFGLCHRMKLI